MASFMVPLTRVREVLPHDNAERLEIVKVYDWLVVTGKGNFKVGDQVVYIPVDSILPPEVEDFLFPMTSKIKLSKHRVRSIKIRGHISQGMVVNPSELETLPNCSALSKLGDETDVSVCLGITKYEPPESSMPAHMQAKAKPKRGNSNFTKYTDIENFKWYDRVFQDGEECYMSEKLHGTSFRAGWYLNEANTIWKKVKKFFGLLPDWEFCWGSRNVQIQCKLYHKGYYDEDVYTKMVRQYDLMNKIPQGYSIYGEIVGDGIQKGYTYGCAPGEHKLYVYDVKYTGVKHPQEYLNYQLNTDDETLGPDHLPTFKAFIEGCGLTPVPCLYVGPFKRDILEQHRVGDSTIGGQKVREGLVLKSVWESNAACGRKCLKVISDEYYLKNDNTDFH